MLPKHIQQKSFLEVFILGLKRKNTAFALFLTDRDRGNKYPHGYSGLMVWAHHQPHRDHPQLWVTFHQQCSLRHNPEELHQANSCPQPQHKFWPIQQSDRHSQWLAESGSLLAQEERRTFLQAKMGLMFLLMDLLIIWEEILSEVWSCVKGRTHSLSWV